VRDEKCIQNFGQNLKRKRPFRRSRCKWEGNIRMDLREIGWEWTRLSGSGEEPVTGSCECGNEPTGSIRGGRFFD